MPSTIQRAGDDCRDDACGAVCYLQDDVERGLRASLISVLTAVLPDKGASAEYLKGVLDLARSQAALYGIPWCDLVARLEDVPELWNLAPTLQDGCRVI